MVALNAPSLVHRARPTSRDPAGAPPPPPPPPLLLLLALLLLESGSASTVSVATRKLLRSAASTLFSGRRGQPTCSQPGSLGFL